MKGLDAEIRPVSGRTALAEAWRALEAEASPRFFNTWLWAEAALAAGAGAPWLGEVRDGARTVALALFWPMSETRNRAFRFRQLRLNEAGAAAGDTVPGEYTDILAAPGYEAAVWPALLDALAAPGAPVWSELIVANAAPALEAAFDQRGYRVHRRGEAGSGRVDLAGLRASGVGSIDAYIAGLGANTRQQIRRSIRLYEDRGPLGLDAAGDVDEALDWYDRIVRLQTARRRARSEKGAGDHPVLVAFHRRLIAAGLPQGRVELLRASAGDDAFAYIYNFLEPDAALFNIAGLHTEADNRLKPGLVAHAMAIARHLEGGRATYDFLAGDDRYKTSLGAPGPKFVSFAVQRPAPAVIAEHALRQVKRRLMGRSGTAE